MIGGVHRANRYSHGVLATGHPSRAPMDLVVSPAVSDHGSLSWIHAGTCWRMRSGEPGHAVGIWDLQAGTEVSQNEMASLEQVFSRLGGLRLLAGHGAGLTGDPAFV